MAPGAAGAGKFDTGAGKLSETFPLSMPEFVALYISWLVVFGGGTPSARGGAVGTGGMTARRSGLLRVAGLAGLAELGDLTGAFG